MTKYKEGDKVTFRINSRDAEAMNSGKWEDVTSKIVSHKPKEDLLDEADKVFSTASGFANAEYRNSLAIFHIIQYLKQQRDEEK